MPNLRNIRVIDLSRLLPGPYCTMLLADMGADVIKIESTLMGDPVRITPPYFDEESVTFAAINRNKRSLAVNYRKPAARELLQALIATGDVLVETFKPGQAARYGLDYESVRAVNPRIVYCSLSGYGQHGPYAHRSGHDINFLALSGALDLLRGRDGRPALPAFQLADVAGGSLAATVAILAALLERTFSGEGQYLDVSIHEGTASLLAVQMAPLLTEMELEEPPHLYLAGELPGYNVYETADGRYMSLGALEPVLWTEFCKAMGREDLASYHLPAKADRQRIIEEVAALFKQRTRAEWEEFFADKDLCCEPVLAVEELDERAYGRISSPALEPTRPGRPAVRQVASPPPLTDGTAPRPAPLLGEHTVEILAQLGYSAGQIDALRSKKVVATPDDVTVRMYRGAEGLTG